MNLTVLAIRLSTFRNGVSRLHGAVSRKLWHNVWPSFPMDEVPIGHITNGIHTRTWLSHEMAELYDRYLGPQWHERPTEEDIWKRMDQIPDTELWRTHERRRERLVEFARSRLRQQCLKRGGLELQFRQGPVGVGRRKELGINQTADKHPDNSPRDAGTHASANGLALFSHNHSTSLTGSRETVLAMPVRLPWCKRTTAKMSPAGKPSLSSA